MDPNDEMRCEGLLAQTGHGWNQVGRGVQAPVIRRVRWRWGAQQGEVAQRRKRQVFVHEDGHRQRQLSKALTKALRESWAAWSGSNRARAA